MNILGALTGRDLLVVAAGFSSLILLGLWDNQRSIEQALDTGYETQAVVTGARRHPRSLFSLVEFEGLRLRFLDERQTWDLSWRGQDGVQHDRYYVPVTVEKFRLVPAGPVLIKVVGASGAAPVVMLDAQDRLIALEERQDFWIWVAIVGWIGLGWNLLLRRADRIRNSASFKRHTAQRRLAGNKPHRIRP